MRSYSLDLRERVVTAYETGEQSIAEVAARFSVGQTFLKKMLRQKRESGSLERLPSRAGAKRVLSEADPRLLAKQVKEQPDATLGELQEQLQKTQKVRVSRATVSRQLQALGVRRKKETDACLSEIIESATDPFNLFGHNTATADEFVNSPDGVSFDLLSFTTRNATENGLDSQSETTTSVQPEISSLALQTEEPEPDKKKYAFTTVEELLREIKRKRDYVEFEQKFERPRHRLSWEMFLVMQLAGRVAYLTKGQMLRYLLAWKKHFEPDIKADFGVIQTLIRKKWLTRTSKPIIFSRGNLKGKSVFPYVMTRGGRQAFGRHDVETANLARIGEPEGKMFDRLEHELLISEVYVHLIEEGNYVYWFVSEENMRREIVQNVWRQWRKREDMTLTDLRLGDFKICYFEPASGRVRMREEEIAVRYKREQIMLKSDDLRWFCYSESEADKVKLLKNKDVVVMTDNLYREVTRLTLGKQKEKSGGKKRDHLVAQWARALGGLTIVTGTILTGLSYRRLSEKLNQMPELRKYSMTFEPGIGWRHIHICPSNIISDQG